MVMFLFLVIALVVVVGAVTLAVLGGGESGGLPEVAPERLTDPLPPDRPLRRADVDSVRFPMTVRGYRMLDVDEALDRLSAELAERDARIAELEAALAGAQATAVAGPGLLKGYGGGEYRGEDQQGAPADARPAPPQHPGRPGYTDGPEGDQ
ncbi:DivIVA domain-containing protein [Streptomyces aureocirculatus]|uniref:DivIVA domain-containing protein n=1 Tax=Streptomyces aureocirculatus TaxID=67275 RepID=UPI00099CBC92|nr:DivIVA domain-containing protein [Streptomyces aureocirculatus]